MGLTLVEGRNKGAQKVLTGTTYLICLMPTGDVTLVKKDIHDRTEETIAQIVPAMEDTTVEEAKQHFKRVVEEIRVGDRNSFGIKILDTIPL